MLNNRFNLIDSSFRSSGGQQKGLFIGGDGAAGDVCGRMFLERRIGVSTSPWSHQGQLVISVSSLSVRRFFKILCTSCLFIYSSPAQEDRGLKVFEPLVGGGTYREVFKFVRCSCLCGDTCQRVTVCGLMSLVATHSEKIKYWVVDFFCGDTLREVLNLWVVDYFLWGFHMRVHVSVETLSERF